MRLLAALIPSLSIVFPRLATQKLFSIFYYLPTSLSRVRQPFCGSDSVIACADARGKQLRNGGGGASCAQDVVNK